MIVVISAFVGLDQAAGWLHAHQIAPSLLKSPDATGKDSKWFKTDVKELGMSFSTPSKPRPLMYKDMSSDTGGSLQARISYSQSDKGSFGVIWVPMTEKQQVALQRALESGEGKDAIARQWFSGRSALLTGKVSQVLNSETGLQKGFPAEHVTFRTSPPQTTQPGDGEVRAYVTSRWIISLVAVTPQGANEVDRQRFFDSLQLPKA